MTRLKDLQVRLVVFKGKVVTDKTKASPSSN
jgi:hypothetical protein